MLPASPASASNGPVARFLRCFESSGGDRRLNLTCPITSQWLRGLTVWQRPLIGDVCNPITGEEKMNVPYGHNIKSDGFG